ncbi:hypothetical protein ARAM_000597 [Aspergillus rambellii]|uniref:DUF7730 domain-containing protein n=1 Tax=Aspergillus rambellii TaxID=308745 RepID=A0A0F8WY87_9EURO|nr:hypothetical protein ARAM_000597 [Aspergillus rambellii]
MAIVTKPQPPAPLLNLPLELRLMIYDYIVAVPNKYTTDRPMIVVNDDGNTFTTRGRYRALSMCPNWVGENGQVRSLLFINHQIHDEVEDFLYSRYTLFFLNSFNLDHLGAFLDMLSPTARNRIRSVGFEIYFFVHSQAGTPKRTWAEYNRAASILGEKLPHWSDVVFYLDPRFCFASCAATTVVAERDLSVRGIGRCWLVDVRKI